MCRLLRVLNNYPVTQGYTDFRVDIKIKLKHRFDYIDIDVRTYRNIFGKTRIKHSVLIIIITIGFIDLREDDFFLAPMFETHNNIGEK